MLEEIIGKSWIPFIGEEFDKPYMQKLAQWLSYTRETKTIYPDSQDVFKAFKLCPLTNVKVVIIGQDPYHNGQADGLCFSYKDGKKLPNGRKQSLDVIINEIENDVYDGFNVNYNYDLSYLAKEGVLLLNPILTVFRGKPNSHKGFGWEQFTNRVLQVLITHPSTPKVFLLWGRDAKKVFNDVKEQIDYDWYNIHLVLESCHPASDLYKMDSFGNLAPDYPNTFAGCKHFTQANDFLKSKNIEPINWFDVKEPYFNKNLKEEFQPF